jgi:hypothetical protein
MTLVKQQIIARCSVCKFTCVSLINTRNIAVQRLNNYVYINECLKWKIFGFIDLVRIYSAFLI